MEYRAVWQGVVLAQSADTVVEGNRYFPADSLRMEYVEPTRMHTLCPWKGLASSYTITVDGATNRNAAWYYPHPTFLARRIKGRVAFWQGVQVEPVPGNSTATTLEAADTRL